jgi:hypothetical protein
VLKQSLLVSMGGGELIGRLICPAPDAIAHKPHQLREQTTTGNCLGHVGGAEAIRRRGSLSRRTSSA